MNQPFNRYLGDLYGNVSLVNDTIKALLLYDSYTLNVDHDFVSDLAPGTNELNDPSYSRLTITGKLITYDDTNNWGVFTCTNPNWATLASPAAIAAMVIYKHVGASDNANPLIFWIDEGFPRTPNGGAFLVRVPTLGLSRAMRKAAA
jgi:hypothetical protein